VAVDSHLVFGTPNAESLLRNVQKQDFNLNEKERVRDVLEIVREEN
jgi:hypothetical protein